MEFDHIKKTFSYEDYERELAGGQLPDDEEFPVSKAIEHSELFHEVAVYQNGKCLELSFEYALGAERSRRLSQAMADYIVAENVHRELLKIIDGGIAAGAEEFLKYHQEPPNSTQ